MDAILTTRDGLSEVPFFSSKDVSCWVKKKGDFKFKSTTLSQPDSGNRSYGAPHAAPALLTVSYTHLRAHETV